jgi:hypothetical protein
MHGAKVKTQKILFGEEVHHVLETCGMHIKHFSEM